MELPSHNKLKRGNSPLLISIPHAGTVLPSDIRQRLEQAAQTLPDTDWFVDQLYDWATAAGAGMLIAAHSRYVIDLNRPPDDKPLYTSENTGLVPLSTFAGDPLYHETNVPLEAEKSQRLQKYWRPYHELLAMELKHIRKRHGHAVLLDAHSIRSAVPGLFSGLLPDLNLGSNEGSSACAELITDAWAVLVDCGYTSALDGRFKGGYITRHYGNPQLNTHALQLEISQRSYMQEKPPVYDDHLARKLQSVLKPLVNKLIDWTPDER